MGKRQDAIDEMVYHVRRMSDGDKVAFVQFMSKYRSCKSLVNMFRAFDSTQPNSSPKGLIKRIIDDKNGNAYKNFHRFKKKIFEFELSTKRLDYFKRYDPHFYYFMCLKKEILASEMLTERNAYHISIQVLKETFKKAGQFEFLGLQKDCLRDMEQFSKYSGQIRLQKRYADEHASFTIQYEQFEEIKKLFENLVFGMRCCAVHKSVTNTDASSVFHTYHKKWPLRNAIWMARFLDAKVMFEQNEHHRSLINSNALKRELNLRPGLYPASFRLSVHLLILENLWYLKKFKLIERYSRKLINLDHFSAYQRIPMLQYFLCYFLWIRKFEMIDLIMSDLDADMAYGHFNSFQARARLVELFSIFLQGDYRRCLMYLNRENRLKYLECHQSEFDMRCIEILCLSEVDEDLLLFDKLESLRRFISRNSDLKTDMVVKSISDAIMRKKTLNAQELKMYHTLMSKRSIFDLRWVIIQELVKKYSPGNFIHFGKYSSEFHLRPVQLSMAAENTVAFETKRLRNK